MYVGMDIDRKNKTEELVERILLLKRDYCNKQRRKWKIVLEYLSPFCRYVSWFSGIVDSIPMNSDAFIVAPCCYCGIECFQNSLVSSTTKLRKEGAQDLNVKKKSLRRFIFFDETVNRIANEEGNICSWRQVYISYLSGLKGPGTV